jgi:hypothetical protein
MQVKWIPTLAALLAAQVALALVLGLRTDRLTPAHPDALLVAADLGAADRLRIDGPLAPDQPASGPAAAKQVELVKRDGRWTLPGHFDAPADATRIEALLKRLQTLRRGFAIATSTGAADRFAVSENHYERRFIASAGGKPIATIYLGHSPGLRKSDARNVDDPAVYAVELASYELPTDADDWLDAGLLAHDVATPVEIDIAAAGSPALTLKRSGSSWRAEDLAPDRRLDAGKAAALATAIAGVKVDAALGERVRPEWRQDQPVLQLAMTDKEGKRVTWTLSKPEKGEEVVLKSSDRPWYLKLQPVNARPLLDAAAPDKLVVAAAPPGQAASAPVAAASAAPATQHARR